MKARYAAFAAAAVLATPAFAFSVNDPMPGEVSVIEDNGKWIFQSDFGHPFYTYDKDTKTHSACDAKCAETWAPVRAHDKAMPMGDWTLVDRGGGYMQWAYKGKPIYMNVPQVVSQSDPELNNDGHWHMLTPE
jgi:predicted lipoprotein with Yx(FWY)xxD motif